jgi:heme-degrading monooxygenase HmoA
VTDARNPIAATSEPPYFAVIFTSLRKDNDTAEYEAMAARMAELAAMQPGFLGVESARGSDGMGITVSYWESLAAIQAWGRNLEHLEAQANGRTRWYKMFHLRISRVEKERFFSSDSAS